MIRMFLGKPANKNLRYLVLPHSAVVSSPKKVVNVVQTAANGELSPSSPQSQALLICSFLAAPTAARQFLRRRLVDGKNEKLAERTKAVASGM